MIWPQEAFCVGVGGRDTERGEETDTGINVTLDHCFAIWSNV